MTRVIAVIAWGLTVAACSASTPSLLNYFSSSPSTETVRAESKHPGAEVKTLAMHEAPVGAGKKHLKKKHPAAALAAPPVASAAAPEFSPAPDAVWPDPPSAK